jgi:signal transduction histidine kinase
LEELNNPQQKPPHFDISAGVVKQLGEELITDEVTAIMELVKNSYDADADWVKIDIYTEAKLPDQYRFKDSIGYIIIEDNGDGMSYNDILTKWLVISVSDKKSFKKEKKETTKGRVPLGDKGLGRLSTQKLGSKLEIITGKKDDSVDNSISFDWNNFNDQTILSEVHIDYNPLTKKKEDKGTRLIISDLKDPQKLERENIDKFRGQLSQLVFPLKEKRPFDIILKLNSINLDLDELNEKLRNQAIGRFSFKYDNSELTINGKVRLKKFIGNSQEDKDIYYSLLLEDNGQGFYNFLTDPKRNRKNYWTGLNFIGEDGWFFEISNTYDTTKDFKLRRIKVDDNDVVAIPGSFSGEIDEYYLTDEDNTIGDLFKSFESYKNLIKNQIGVRVFRDGFGIKPYGFEQNDWLGLGKSSTSGKFYNLRPNNVIGYVSLSKYENENLKEKTDREGFVDSPYSENFFLLMSEVVKAINTLYTKARISYNKYKEEKYASKHGIVSYRQSTARITATAAKAKAIETAAARIETEIQYQKNQIEGRLISADVEKNTTHVFERIKIILDQSTILFEELNQIIKQAKTLEDDASYLNSKIEDMENQLLQFTELAALGLSAEALTHELYNILDRISNQTFSVAKKIKGVKNIDTSVFVFLENVKSFVKNIRVQLNHLSPSLRYNKEELEVFDVSTFVNDLVGFYKQRERFKKIEFIVTVKTDFKVEVNKGRLLQVFDNIILNSEYWLNVRSKEEKSFKPSISIEITNPYIKVNDNGYGISPSIEDRLFQPFITTKPKNEGRGLGLFITQQILESLGCQISLLNDRNVDERRFIFQIIFDSIIKP